MRAAYSNHNNLRQESNQRPTRLAVCKARRLASLKDGVQQGTHTVHIDLAWEGNKKEESEKKHLTRGNDDDDHNNSNNKKQQEEDGREGEREEEESNTSSLVASSPKE